MGGYSDALFWANESKVVPGVRRQVRVGTPAAGNEWTVNVPGGRHWRIVGGQALLTASAAVANRLAGVRIVSLGTTIWVSGTTTAVVAAANTNVVYQQGPGPIDTGAQTAFTPVSLPSVWLTTGDVITSLTAGLDVADAYTLVSLVVEETFFDDTLLTNRELFAEEASGDRYDFSSANTGRLNEYVPTGQRG